jgi:protein-S-isoprenylcysteine O-methyltransferase Ste14
MRKGSTVLIALALHALLLALPALVLGQPEALLRPALLVWGFAALVLQAVELWTTRGHDDTISESTLDTRLAALTGVLLLLIQWISASEFALRGSPAPALWLPTAGGLLLFFGIALRWSAMRALGADFVSSAMGRTGGRLVRRGVYSRLRHPSELGLLAFAAGGCALLGSLAGAALAVLVLTPLVVWRARLEDRALCARFSDYPTYAAAVGGLLPR